MQAYSRGFRFVSFANNKQKYKEKKLYIRDNCTQHIRIGRRVNAIFELIRYDYMNLGSTIHRS
jgi:hypothetical protein